MRARTLTILAVLLLLAAPARARAAPYVMAEHEGVVEPYAGQQGGILDLNSPAWFVATGTLSHLSAAVSSTFGLDGSASLFLGLYDPSHDLWLDCQTPIKTIDEWGITHLASDPVAPMIDFSFSGNQCGVDTEQRSTEEDIRILISDTYALRQSSHGAVGWASDAAGEFDFTAYADNAPAAAATTTGATASSVLFLPGTEASRLYMRLPEGAEKQVWEPALDSDIKYLAINADGTSVNTLYTKDIVDTIFGNDHGLEQALAQTFAPGDLEVYSGLEKFLDQMVASSTIKEWRAYPYDWRYDPAKVVSDGTLTEEPDGSLERVYLADVVKDMASASPTGKVTILAHSNGGLVAKALVAALGANAANYIDRVILVGTPQFGTPSAIGSLLHGDGQSIGFGIVAAKASVRAEAQVIPDAYALLPSPAYFAHVATPVVTFSTDSLLAPFVAAFGSSISSFGPFESFADDGKQTDEQFDNSTINAPLPLSLALIEDAKETHDSLDSWQAPGILVTAIAGWGQLTPETLAYTKATSHTTCTRPSPLQLATCSKLPILSHTETKTEDGDGVVVSPSAIGDISDAWYFNAKKYGHEQKINISHQNLTSAQPIQDAIAGLLENNPVNDTYLLNTEPATTKNPLAIISSHSPVNLVAVDADGNKTGIVPIPGSDLALQVQDIPESAVDLESGDEYLDLPQDGSYSITATGYSSGPTTLEVQDMDETGAVEDDETFADIPTTPSTTATFSVDGGIASNPQVDLDGDSQIELEVASDTPATLAPSDALALLHAQIFALDVRPGIKNRLLQAVEKVESEQGNLAGAQSDIARLGILISAQTGVKLSDEQGASMLELLEYLKL